MAAALDFRRADPRPGDLGGDQIQISLMPLLLDEGLRLFEHIGSTPRRLEKMKVIDSPVRTDIRYRVGR